MNKSTLCSALLIVLCTYIQMPFYFAAIESVHKLLFYVFSILPLLYTTHKGVKKKQGFSLFTLEFLFYFICIILILVTSQSFNFAYTVYFLRFFIGLCANISLFFCWKYATQNGKCKESFILIYVKGSILYIIGTVFFIAFPTIKIFWQDIIIDYQRKDFTSFLNYITRFGFAGYSGFTCAFWITSSVIYFTFLYINRFISQKQAKTFSMLLIIGSFFYGRIGIITSFMCFGLLILYCVFHNRLRFLQFYLFILFVFVILSTILYITVPTLKAFFEWMVEPIANFFLSGTLSSASTDNLSKMYQNFSPTLDELFYGSGYWLNADESYYGHTDVGWMRNILYGGIFYTIILYLLGMTLILLIYFYLRKIRAKGAFLLCLQLFIVFCFFEIKGDITFLFIKAFIPLLFYLSEVQFGQLQKYSYLRRFSL